MKIVVLGGAGKMGCISVQDLALDNRVDEIVIADYDTDQAEVVRKTIGSQKISIEQLDVKDDERLLSILDGADACLNATVYYFNIKIMEACLEKKVHYTDMGGLFHTTLKQLELSDRFKKAGISAALGMGSAPGVPNLQTRYAAEFLDTVESIKIYDGIKPGPADTVKFTYAVPTIIDELTEAPMVFENGEFVSKNPLTGFEDYWFSPPVGLLPMHYSLHSEVATLPVSFQDKGVKECFFKINYWGMPKETVDKIKVLADFGFAEKKPVTVNGSQVAPHALLVKMMSSYVPPITDFLAPPANKPPNWTKEIVTEIVGKKGKKDLIFRLGTLTCKGALPTGVFPARSAVWLAQGKVKPGVYPPELAFEAKYMLKEVENRDIYTRVTITEPI